MRPRSFISLRSGLARSRQRWGARGPRGREHAGSRPGGGGLAHAGRGERCAGEDLTTLAPSGRVGA